MMLFLTEYILFFHAGYTYRHTLDKVMVSVLVWGDEVRCFILNVPKLLKTLIMKISLAIGRGLEID
jgi:hypothetical protein